jgi:cell division protein FtsB
MTTREPRSGATAGTVYTPRNHRPLLRRRLSPSTIMLSLLGAAVAIVLYISNIIAVNQLLREIGELDAQQRRMNANRELLRSQINRLSGLDRIQELAEDRLSLHSPQTPPIWITVDTMRIHTLEQATATE